MKRISTYLFHGPIGAMETDGFSNFKIQLGSFIYPLANDYLRRCLRAPNDFFSADAVVLFIDYAACYSGAELIFEEPEFQNHKLLCIGSYSPMLDPIEAVWSNF